MHSRTSRTPDPSNCHTAAAIAVVVSAGALGVVVPAAPAAASPATPTARITAPASASVGDALPVVVTMPGTADVYSYQIDIAADHAVVTVVDGSVHGPDGGFDDVRRDGDTVTLLHTRLGTSPPLAGDLAASVEFMATGVGSADLTVSRITTVGADGSTTTLTDPASTRVTVGAAPTAAPTAPVPTAPPTASPGAGPGGTGPDADTARTASMTSAGGALAWTGADLLPGVATCAGLLLSGGALVVARRRARRRTAEDAR
jgi:hypothetical protein